MDLVPLYLYAEMDPVKESNLSQWKILRLKTLHTSGAS